MSHSFSEAITATAFGFVFIPLRITGLGEIHGIRQFSIYNNKGAEFCALMGFWLTSSIMHEACISPVNPNSSNYFFLAEAAAISDIMALAF